MAPSNRAPAPMDYTFDFTAEGIRPVTVTVGAPDDGPVMFDIAKADFGPTKEKTGMMLSLVTTCVVLDAENNPLKGHGHPKKLYFVWPGTMAKGRDGKPIKKSVNDLFAGKLKGLWDSIGLAPEKQRKANPSDPKFLDSLVGLQGYGYYRNGVPRAEGQERMKDENFDVMDVLLPAEYNDAIDGKLVLNALRPKKVEGEAEPEDTEPEDENDDGGGDTEPDDEGSVDPEDVYAPPEETPAPPAPPVPTRVGRAAPAAPPTRGGAPNVQPPAPAAADAARRVLNGARARAPGR